MKATAIIPARYASTRFPGKPLVNILGKTMVRRVYEQAQKAKTINQVWVATDDQRIFDEVKSFGGQAIMTSSQHQTGTDRIAEAAMRLKIDADVIINIQGDEPFIHPEQIDSLINFTYQNLDNYAVCTLAKRLSQKEKLFNPDTIKVVFDKNQKAIYFSRQAIPFQRDSDDENWLKAHPYFKHIGLYSFNAKYLSVLAGLTQSPLEKAESLEQLRWMENGYAIGIIETQLESQSIDSPNDLTSLLERLKR